MKPKEIIYKDANYGFTNAFVGNIKIGSYGYNSIRNKADISKTKEYVLTVNLPGVVAKLYADNPKEAREIFDLCLKKCIELLTDK